MASLVGAALLFSGCPALSAESSAPSTPPTDKENVILQLRWDHQFQFAGYYAALWLGYYADAGFDVQIRSAFEPGGKFHKVTGEVAAGRADFGTGGADILIDRDKGAPLVIVSSVFQRSPVAFYARAETGLQSITDLTRLRVGTRPNGIAGIELRAMLRAESIDPALVTQHPIKGKLGIHDLAARHLDVASGFTISAGWYARELGLKLTSLTPQTYGVDFYGGALFTNQRWVSEKPALVQKFAAASLKGWEYAIRNPGEIADRISRDLKRKIPITNIVGFNRFQSREVARLTHFPVVQLGHTNAARWARMHDALKDAGSVTGNFIADDVIFDYARLRRAQVNRRNKIIMAVLGGILVIGGAGWLLMMRRNLQDRRRANRDLRESEERFRDVAESVSDWIWEMGPDLKFTWLSPRVVEILGMPAEYYVGKLRADMMSSEDDPVLWRNHIETLEAQQPFENFLVQRLQPDGRLLRFSLNGKPLFDPDGGFLGYRGTGRDISAETDAQREAERSTKLLMSAIENFSDMVAVYDRDERLVMINSAFRKDVGPDVAIGDNFETVQRKRLKSGRIPNEARDNEEAWLAQRVDYFRNPKGPLEAGAPDFKVQIRFEKLPDGGTITFISDITEQKHREEALSQAQKMEAVGQLTGGIAHDFNNLLTVVIGNLELAADDAGDNANVVKFINKAGQAAERGAELTHRLLAFSRKQDLVPSIIDVGDLIVGMSNLMRSSLGETIAIDIISGQDLWLCKADAGQLENTILNLGINARDAMPTGGTLTISTENIDMNDDYAAAAAEIDPGEYVLIAVSDTGTGMPRDVMDHAFEPFFTTKEVGQGSGLGLSMVYGFAKQSGGHATIYSEEGVGSTIKIYLPKSSRPMQDAAPIQPEQTPRSRGETILVVEDNPDVRTLTVALLRELGYEIIEASDAAAALRALETAPRVNLLFSDVVLPGGTSGIELAEKIRELRPGISVLFTSGYTEQAIASQGAHDGDIELLGKPFKKDALAQRIRTVLDQR